MAAYLHGFIWSFPVGTCAAGAAGRIPDSVVIILPGRRDDVKKKSGVMV